MQANSDDDASNHAADAETNQVAVGARVRVYPGTDAESFGVVVEDFGDMSRVDVRGKADQIAAAPRRWAVVLDDGSLVFANSDQITAD